MKTKHKREIFIKSAIKNDPLSFAEAENPGSIFWRNGSGAFEAGAIEKFATNFNIWSYLTVSV